MRPAFNLFTMLAETVGVGGQSPGVQGAAATGRPLCAPCAMRGITQKKYRSAMCSELTQSTCFPRPKPLQTDNSIYWPVAPVSASATGDFDLRREPDRSAGDRSRPARSRRRFRHRSASWCW
ncbi:hypothetical protein BK800_17805 [Klebsiella aerogenes]|nr:hypothetical protein BK800_17805 [Klebsiella aerogenes]